MAGQTLLDIPFDGSAVDISLNPAAVTITGHQFVAGRPDPALTPHQSALFPGVGYAEVVDLGVPLPTTYTLTAWVRALGTATGPTDSYVLFKFVGSNRFLQLPLRNSLTGWNYVVVTQDVNAVAVYLNSRQVSVKSFPAGWGRSDGSGPTGFALLNDNPSSSAGFDNIEDVTLYEGAATREIINIPRPQMDVNYSINNQNFKSYGVYVSKSDGIIDNLDLKEPLSVEWPDYHGQVMDLSKPRYQPREITLSCFIVGVGKDEFIERVSLFLAQFQKPNTQRLHLSVHSAKPLVYEVYCPGSVGLNKKWSDEQMVGTFELKLREPEPVKRVLKFGAGTATITLTSARMLTVFWGDGTKTTDVFGTAKTITHLYSDSADHYIIIAGVIEDITGFSSNATVVWNRL